MLQLRTKMVPLVSFASNTIQWLLLAGIVVAQWTPIPLYIAIALFACTVLFSFVTLPVEVDASRRAIQWLQGSGIVSGQQLEYAKDALHAAAYTYVVAAIGSLATLLYYVLMIFGGNRR
jgi:Zn-dependent membrane protease YugP